MVNIVVYLESQHDPAELIKELLEQNLVATVSVDRDNIFYMNKWGKPEMLIHTVITMQTRALLFNEICRVITARFGDHVHIHSTPIVAANSSFEHLIKSNTMEPDQRILTVLTKNKSA
jgi:hypothetical protein